MAKKINTKTKAIAESAGPGVNTSPVGDSITTTGPMSFAGVMTTQQAYSSSPTFRRAVNILADTEAKAAVRLFSRKTGDEIIGGACYELFRRPSKFQGTGRFISDMVKWFKIHGEIAILPNTNGLTAPSSMRLLNPAFLIANPQHARCLEQVDNWLYSDGFYVDKNNPILQIPAHQLVFGKNFNPRSEVRGESEAIALTNEISTNHYIQRYNGSRFRNGVEGDLLFVFPKGTKKASVTDFMEKYQSDHGVNRDNGFKITAVVGDDVKVSHLGIEGKDGQYLKLSEYNDERIAGLFGVPASVMGFYGKTRFDTIDGELETFAENTVLPDLVHYTELFQTQIVDRYFPSAVGATKASRKLSSITAKALDEARDGQGESEIIILLDPDTLPIMAKLNRSKASQAKQFRESLDLSANEAAEYAGLDIPYNKLRDDIWIPNNRVNISQVSRNRESTTTEVPQTTELVEEAKTLPVDKEKLNEVKEFFREFRKLALESISTSKWIEKTELAKRAKDLSAPLHLEFHSHYLKLRAIYNSSEKMEIKLSQTKALFNSISKPAVIKGLIKI